MGGGLMGGGFFDDTFEPYSGAYVRPRAQYQQPAPARAPEVRSASRREEPLLKKTVRTIPVTDGADVAPVATREGEKEGAVNLAPVLASLRSKDAAATKIQAVYRGYLVRKTQPLKHLRVVKKVKEELEGLRRRLEEPEQKKRICSDAQERLRWTEGVMALLLRLDTLQGVHPEVRLLRKALTKELIQFQETIDTMSAELEVSAAKSGEDGAVTTSEKHVPQVQLDMHDQVVDSGESGPLPEIVGDDVGFVLEPVSEEADPEAPVDVEKEQILTTVSATEEIEVEPATSQIDLPPMDVESDHNDEPLKVENSVATEDASVTHSNVEDMWRRYEAGRLTEDAERPALQDMVHNSMGDVSDSGSDAASAHLEEKETTSRFMDREDGWMIPADCTRSMDCIDELQVSQPSTADDDINALSDRALMLQLLDDNRKLKDVVENVLHWGKHQNDVIRNLAARVEQLEEEHSQRNLLEDEENTDRKTKGNDGSLQRKGKPGNKPQLGNYIDSEDWPSAESDEYF